MKKMVCPLCKREVPGEMYEMHRKIDEMIIERMKKDFPGWKPEEGSCKPCLERYMNKEAKAA